MRRWLLCILSLLALGCTLAVHASLLAELPAGRVELAGDRDKLEPALDLIRGRAGEMVLPEHRWEGDRAVFTGGNLFTGQLLAAELGKAGVGPEDYLLLDYAWAPHILAQSGELWRLAAALALLALLAALGWRLVRAETRRFREAMEDQYPAQYAGQAGIRLLWEAVLAAVGIFLALFLSRWLWHVPIILPAGWLPAGSIFDPGHYRAWWESRFPAAGLSDYGAALAVSLGRAHLLAALECAGAVLLAASFARTTRPFFKHDHIWGDENEKKG